MSARGLGRGFESLIPTDFNEAFDPTASEDKKSSKLVEIKLTDIEPDKDQPRRNFKPEPRVILLCFCRLFKKQFNIW